MSTLKALRLAIAGLLLIAALSSNLAAITEPSYRINSHAKSDFAGKDARTILAEVLEKYPNLKQRMLDPTYLVPSKEWGYHTQTYKSEAVMQHLLAIQIKAMADSGDIRNWDDLTDTEHGIGSKDHKDKGTLKNPLSIWGHPVQTEILGQKSRLRALKVYHAFRTTIKNDLIRYARNQDLEWHLQSLEDRLQAVLSFLNSEHRLSTLELRNFLIENKLELKALLRKALETNLLS